MTFFNGRKKSKILMVTLMVMALLVTSAIPMTVFATGVDPGVNSTEPSSEGTGGEGGDTSNPGESNNPGEGENGEPGAGGSDDSGEGTDVEIPGAGDVEQPGANMGDGQTVNLMMEPMAESMLIPTYGLELDVEVDNKTPMQGETVTYTYTVRNTGDGELNVKLTDEFLGDKTFLGIPDRKNVTLLNETLAGKTSRTVEYEHTISENYYVSKFKNDAKAVGKGSYVEWVRKYFLGVLIWEGNVTRYIDKSATASKEIQIKERPDYAIEFTKEASALTVLPGGTIEYTFKVKNMGKKDLKTVLVTDEMLGEDWLEEWDSLSKNSVVTCSAIYRVDEDASGALINEATVTAFSKNVSDWDKLGQWLRREMTIWDFIKELFKKDIKYVQDTATCTVTVLSKPPTLRETVKFFVLKDEYDRPGEEKSQPIEHFTNELDTLIITDPGITVNPGMSLINEFAPEADSEAVENRVKELGGEEAYAALMDSINGAMSADIYGSSLPEGDWYIDWYDFKWEADGWHVDGDIQPREGPPVDPPTSPAAISLTKTVSPAAVTSKDAAVTYTFLIENTGGVNLYGVTLMDSSIGTLNESIGNLAVDETTTVAINFDLSLLGTEDYGNWEGNTFTNVATVTGCEHREEPARLEGIAQVEPACVTATASAVVTYTAPDNPGPGPGPGGRDDDGGRTSSTKSETTIPDQPTPAGPATDGMNILLEEEAVPAGSLPKTGGTPALLLYGLGALLAGGGLALRRKENKEK